VHHAINYKDKDFRKQLKKVGLVDLYFDNGEDIIRQGTSKAECTVGGEILDMVLGQLQVYARVVLCGMIAAYK
jgi:NADPH-dependent curcumin reductase CurA